MLSGHSDITTVHCLEYQIICPSSQMSARLVTPHTTKTYPNLKYNGKYLGAQNEAAMSGGADKTRLPIKLDGGLSRLGGGDLE